MGEHRHCWHVNASYSNFVGGADDEQCCQCGATRQRAWHLEDDPKHGQYARVKLKVYDDPKTS